MLAAVSAAPSLSAQSGSAEAAELFKQGRAALQTKDYATACPKFVASLRLERAVGTLISLADCEQATGRLASARQHWQEAADFADALHDSLNRGAYADRSSPTSTNESPSSFCASRTALLKMLRFDAIASISGRPRSTRRSPRS